MLFADAHKILKNLGAKELQSGGLVSSRAAAALRWIQSEFVTLRAGSMYP